MSKIKIAIPTFNRAESLKKRLEELTPHLGSDIGVVVYDNGSTDATSGILAGCSHPNIEVRRWNKNRGIIRNFIRVLEETNGEWIWMLSDDDPVRLDAVTRILGKITKTSAGVIAFKAQGNSICKNALYTNMESYLNEQHVMDLSYISGLVIHRSAVEAGLATLAPASYTLLPHAMLALAALAKGIPIETVAEEILVQEEGEHRVSRREFMLGLAAFPEFFPNKHIRQIVARQLRAASRWMALSALAQTNNQEEIERWRSLIAITEASFSANGAGWRHGAFCTRWHTKADLRREMILPVVRRLPGKVLIKVAKRLAEITHHSSEITHRDAEV